MKERGKEGDQGKIHKYKRKINSKTLKLFSKNNIFIFIMWVVVHTHILCTHSKSYYVGLCWYMMLLYSYV